MNYEPSPDEDFELRKKCRDLAEWLINLPNGYHQYTVKDEEALAERIYRKEIENLKTGAKSIFGNSSYSSKDDPDA